MATRLATGDIIMYSDPQDGFVCGMVKEFDRYHITVHRKGRVPLMAPWRWMVKVVTLRENLTNWWEYV